MGFGTLEGSWTASVDEAFSGSNMTYLAATGDSGAPHAVSYSQRADYTLTGAPSWHGLFSQRHNHQLRMGKPGGG
jgi:hypothetical protein